MKVFFKIILGGVWLLLLSCDSKSAWDCIKTPGTGIEYEETVEDFHSVTVRGHMDVVLIQDSTRKLKVKTRQNLVRDVQVEVVDGVLFLEDLGHCDIFKNRSYTTVYVSAPKLMNIRNASTGTITNEGVWKQDKIALIAENHQDPSYYNNGVFNMHLETGSLSVLANGTSLFQLEGDAEYADIAVFSGGARVEAESMPIQTIKVYHRGSNHLLLQPMQAIHGEILFTGDVRVYSTPEIVEVEEKYSGRLIFVE